MENCVWLLMAKYERDDAEYIPICVYSKLVDAQAASEHYYAGYILKMGLHQGD